MEQLATKKESFQALPSGLNELFLLGPKLADGPSSQLIEAEDLQTGERGLLKVLDSEAFGVAERHRILREWTRQQKLVTSSDVVVAPLRCGQHDGVIWQFRNNIPGIPLDVVIQDGPLPMGDAIAIAAQVALGLSELHGEGFLHRDLKPEHVLFRGRGKNGPRVALIDAGVSVSIAVKSPYPIFGTVGYVSPEQVAGRLVSFRSDLYALGCVLYEMLTGRKLFDGDDIEAILEKHVTAERPSVPNGVPQAVARLLTSLLDRSPRKRPHSADQVFRTLSPFTDDGVRKLPLQQEGEGKTMQRKFDLGVSDTEELRRATLLGMPSQPNKGNRPPAPPTETLPPPALMTRENESAVLSKTAVPSITAVPSVKALSGAVSKPEIPVRETLTTASVAGPPPINAPGYQSKAPAVSKANQNALPMVNAPGYSSIAPSGLLDLNVPLEDLDYEDLEDTDAMKAKFEGDASAERDPLGTLVDIPREVTRDANGTAVLAFDEIEPVEEDDIVSVSKAPAEIFEGVNFDSFEDVTFEEVSIVTEQGDKQAEPKSTTSDAAKNDLSEAASALEALADPSLDLPNVDPANVDPANVDLANVDLASADEVAGNDQDAVGLVDAFDDVDAPVLAAPSIPGTLKQGKLASKKQTLNMPVAALALPTAPTERATPIAPTAAVVRPAARETEKSNRGVWVAALLGTFMGTLVLGGLVWWLSGSSTTPATEPTTSNTTVSTATELTTPTSEVVTASAPPVVDRARDIKRTATKASSGEAKAEDVRILPIEGEEPEASEAEASTRSRRPSSRARRERARERVAAQEESAKATTLEDVANAASARQAKAAAKSEQRSALEPRNERSEAAPAQTSAFDLVREQAKDAFVARRYPEAAALYQRATTMNPRHAGAFAGLGASRLAQGDAHGAALAYIKAVNLAPQNSRYFVALGHAYLRAGDRNNAKRAYDKALSINPNLKSAQTALEKL